MMEKAKEVKCSEFGDAVIEWMDDKTKGKKGNKGTEGKRGSKGTKGKKENKGTKGKKKAAKKVVKRAKKKSKK